MTLLEACGANKIITVNSHNPEVLKAFRTPVEDLSAVSLLADYFKNKGFNGALSISLGKKATDIAEQANNVLRGGYGCLPTQRDRMTGKVKIEIILVGLSRFSITQVWI